MRWKAEDMEKIVGMEEFVDTLLYPVCVSPAKWDRNWIAAQLWLERVSGYAEQQLTGRLFLFQPLSVPKEDGYLLVAHPFIEQNMKALALRFPYCMVITNDEELAVSLNRPHINTYVISNMPDESITKKAYLEKVVTEGNKVVKNLVSIWKK